MSRGRDGDASRRSDEELLASLYDDARQERAGGERGAGLDTLDAASGERRARRGAGGGVSEDDELDRELAQMRQLRGMFAELRANQEEPPPSGMAFLMAAARQAAEERKAAAEQQQPAGLWARLRAGWFSMAAHPAMAAAVAAVVVIGASGYLMSRGVGKKVEPTYSSGRAPAEASAQLEQEKQRAQDGAARSAPAPDPAPAATTATAQPSPRDGEVDATGAGSASAVGAQSGDVAPEQVRMRKPAREKSKAGPADDLFSEGGRADGKARPASTPVGGMTAAPSGSSAGKDKLDANYAKQNSDASGAPGASAPKAGAARDAQASAAEAPPPPPPPPPPPASPVSKASPAKKPATEDRSDEDAAGATSESVSASDEEEEAPKPKPRRVESVTQQAERWYQLALTAAAKGNCGEVKLLAERVRGEDQAFYEKTFSKNPALKKCL